jgi:hypothetical protein
MSFPEVSFLWNNRQLLAILAAILLALIVIGWVLFRLQRLSTALKQINDLRDPVLDLRRALDALLGVDLKEQLAELREGTESVRKQLAELQRRDADERALPAVAVETQGFSPSADKWEDIRTIWTEVRDRLEQVIYTIPDHRLRRKYAGLTRYSYADINNALRNDGLITNKASEAVEGMNDIFLACRHRSRPVTRGDLEKFKQLKELFNSQISRIRMRR